MAQPGQSTTGPARRIEPGLLAAGVIEALRGTGFALSFTYLALYLHTQRGMPMTRVGLILLCSGVLAGLCQLVGGMAADRFGHRRTFVIYQSAELFAFGTVAALMATNSPLWSVVLAVVLAPCLGGMAGTSMSAIIADLSTRDRLTESYGLLAIASNVGWAIGPMAGGFLLGVASYSWLFAAGAGIACLSLAGVRFLPRGREVADTHRLSVRNLGRLLTDHRLVTFCGLCLLFFLSMAQWGSTLSVFAVEWLGFTPERYGFLMSISGVLIVAFQYPVSRRIERLGLRRALVLGSLLYGIGFLSFGWVGGFVPAVGSIVVLVAGEMLFVPAALAVVGKMSDPEHRGKNMGLFGLAGTLGTSMGPLLGGFVLDAFPGNAPFLWAAVSASAFAASFGFLAWRSYPVAAAPVQQAGRSTSRN